MKKGRFNIVVGGQAGSESKGKLAAYLVQKFRPEAICMAASPNAGHTAYKDGIKYVSYHLPISSIMDGWAKILLGPSSVINVDILFDEMEKLGTAPGQLVIHPRATIIRAGHIRQEREAGLLKIGSTNQGVGTARADKLMRDKDVLFAADVPALEPFLGDTVFLANAILDRGDTILCEMTQGFDLDLEHGIHPHYCTSKMINPAMAMAEAGVSPKMVGDIYGVIRPYPIRVNNREGSSGPYAESPEISWDLVKLRCECPIELQEMTTTTKLPRRVFEFSHYRMQHFTQVCRPDFLCLQFVNYLNWIDYKGTYYSNLSEETTEFIEMLEKNYAPVSYIGTSEEDMIDRHMDEEDYRGNSKVQADAAISGGGPSESGEGVIR